MKSGMNTKDEITVECPECGEEITINLEDDIDGGVSYSGGCCGKQITLFFQEI